MDLLRLALTLDQPAFTVECPFPILLAVNEATPAPSQELFTSEEATSGLFGSEEALFATTIAPSPPQLPAELPTLYAVKKANMMVPQSIILGRASTSDILIQDRHISKLHALFQCVDGTWELSDAGSRNGTCVGNVRLQPRGEAMPLKHGDILSFGYRTFYFLDAASCWERLRQRR